MYTRTFNRFYLQYDSVINNTNKIMKVISILSITDLLLCNAKRLEFDNNIYSGLMLIIKVT